MKYLLDILVLKLLNLLRSLGKIIYLYNKNLIFFITSFYNIMYNKYYDFFNKDQKG
jgi:hypothetical protein